ncbi:MAG: 50S ribosomal protein L35 [Alphaproteobacteria bacterium]|jgi:large subunit ribosomal protein L35|nr:50S ribosomal protein L35 [Alphaproteobacteria bacterium]MDP7222201.1 50S ribosomal protein L35 [Alphaproteobacteria bacterium]
MPKMKTKSGAKKRFKVTASGKVRAKQAYTSHMMMNKPKSMKRNARGTTELAEADQKTVLRNWLPYNRKKKKTGAPKSAEGGK